MPTIIQKPIWTNYEKGRGEKHPELIVIHIIALPGITAESAYEHFSNSKSEVSAHYIIKRTGEIWQCILDSDTAWANGSISFKNGKPILPTNPIARRAWQTGVRINQISLSIENEGSEYEDITPAQYESNVFLIKELSRRFNIPIDSTHICGHREIKQEKLCPGRISVGKIIAMCNEPIKTPVSAPTIPAVAYTTANITVNPPLTDLNWLKPSWLLNLEYRVKSTLGFADPMFGGVPRSSKWNALRNQFIKANPKCEACGVKAETVHHCEPYHLKPELELKISNLISLCDECHLVLAHLKSFQRYEKDIREVAKLFRAKIENWS